MTARLRFATPDDAAAVAAIYAPFVADSAVSFETEPPDAEEVRVRITAGRAEFPWLVAETGGAVVGYAYAGRHRSRAAYRWSVDVSVYLAAAARRQGLGTRLYTALLALLRAQGLVNAYAGIALPNPASVALHESLGFTPVGVYRHVGHKAGHWHDVGWWAAELTTPAAEPAEPVPCAELEPALVARILTG